METQKYTININLYRETTSTKMKQSNLFVSVILHFIKEHYRKTNKGKTTTTTKQKQVKANKQTKNKREMKLIPPFLPFHFERNINQLCDQ